MRKVCKKCSYKINMTFGEIIETVGIKRAQNMDYSNEFIVFLCDQCKQKLVVKKLKDF